MFSFLPNLHLDRLSFWLGFVAASLFWWIFSKVKEQIPGLRTNLKTRLEGDRKKGTAVLDDRLRKITLFKAQSMHLAAPLFSLDEVLLPPKLLSPALPIEQDGSLPEEDYDQLVIPNIPDWPELAAPYCTQTITIEESIKNGVNIVIIGKPGSGKTVTLAHLASQVARQKPELGDIAEKLPLLIHVGDLKIAETPPYAPFDAILLAVTQMVPVSIRRKLPRYLRSVFISGQVLLLFDGIDELNHADIDKFSLFLSALLKEFPLVRIVMTGADDYLGRLLSQGFVPLALSSWGHQEKRQFVHQWNQQWQQLIDPLLQKRNYKPPVELTILDDWLLSENEILSPLELTLKVWAVYTGDAQGSHITDAIAAHIRRLIPDDKHRAELENLALSTVLAGRSLIPVLEANSLFPETERVIPEMVSSGLFLLRHGDYISFSHSVIMSYLAALAMKEDEQLTRLVAQTTWSGRTLLLHYLVIHYDMNSIVDELIKQGVDDPLNRNLFMVARWIPDAPASEIWRGKVMRQLLELLKREDLCLSVRGRALAALINSNDPSIATVFRQTLTSTSPVVRQLGSLGCGAVRDTKSITDLGGLLSDPVPWVRYSACMALVAINTSSSIKIATEVLMYGDETLGRIAAEALSTLPLLGHEILQESSASNNLLVRRATVFGLMRINQKWTIDILEKMRIEDGQWVVRNAASHAIDVLQQPNHYHPRPLQLPHQTPWLVAFAGKQGGGISPTQSVKEIVFNVLTAGTSDEKRAVLNYLRFVTNPDPGLVGTLYRIIFNEDGPIREAAAYALWLVAMSGTILPSPVEFGLSQTRAF
jgi:hypothetical protein